MKTDSQLQQEVIAQLKWEPLLKASDIGVSAKDGIVTLTGVVDSYAKKEEAEDAAKLVAGVKAVVEEIEIKWYSHSIKKDDKEIAAEVVNALKWDWQVPSSKVKVTVEKGWVTLEGELHWNYERNAARDAVKSLLGVTGVSNNIKIKSESNEAIEKSDIEGALGRNWAIDAKDITVRASGHDVTLSGTVGSWYQKNEAEKIAWKAPGIWNVKNDLIVEYDY